MNRGDFAGQLGEVLSPLHVGEQFPLVALLPLGKRFQHSMSVEDVHDVFELRLDVFPRLRHRASRTLQRTANRCDRFVAR
jgi:hypothetical protein